MGRQTKKPRFDSFLMNKIFLRIDDQFPSGFSVDAKWVGNALDDVIGYMEDHKIKVIPELEELKQFLRFKGNSLREQGDTRYWKSSEME